MENTSPLSLDRNDGNHGPDQIVDALQTIVSDVDAFLSNWFQQLDQCVESFNPDAAPDAILQKRWSDFQSEKGLWKMKRDLEEREIQAKAGQLTEAWLQLEQEQRKFLQMKDPQRYTGAERRLTNGVKSRPDREDLPPVADVKAGFAEPSSREIAELIHQPESFSTARGRDSAVRQFQQLRREIESSRPKIEQTRGTSDRVRPIFGDRP